MTTEATPPAVTRELSPINQVMAHLLLTTGDLLCFGKPGAEHSELCTSVAWGLQAKDEALRMAVTSAREGWVAARAIARENGENAIVLAAEQALEDLGGAE